MRDSEFKKAYLNIIKEGLGDMAMGEEAPVTASAEEAPATDSTAKRVCFTTTNEELINALTTGFEEVVFFVPTKDEQGNETVSEVKVGKDAVSDVQVSDVEAEGEVADECGEVTGEEDEVTSEEDEVSSEDIEGEEGEVEEDLEAEDLESEEDEVTDECDECGCEGEKSETETEDGDLGEEVEEGIDPSEWIEDGVCVKCGSSECKGDCKYSSNNYSWSWNEKTYCI